jgi:predicted metalloendopeptidase
MSKYIKYINQYYNQDIINKNDDIQYENYDKQYINYINKLFKNKILFKKFLIFKFFEYIVNVYFSIHNIYEYIYIVYNNFISSVYKSELYKNSLTKKVYDDVKDIFNNLIYTYKLEIKNHNDIKDDYKKYILDKLNNIKIEIGYPKHNIKYNYKINNSFL